MGAGIKGNQSIGGLDAKAIGRPISLETGEMTDNGVMSAATPWSHIAGIGRCGLRTPC